MAKETTMYCPNCGRAAVREGNNITCEACDAVFAFKHTGPVVKQVGRLEAFEGRLAIVEAALLGEPEPEPEPNNADDDDTEEDLL